MRVNLVVKGQRFGFADWGGIPPVGHVGLFESLDGTLTSRRIISVELRRSGEPVVHLSDALPPIT
jgi:hypothetical protein